MKYLVVILIGYLLGCSNLAYYIIRREEIGLRSTIRGENRMDQ